MSSANSIVGAGSLMPEDMYLRKYESSCVYEDPDLIEGYTRNQLKKTGPIQGFFESDQKRTNYDTLGRLAIRDGGKRCQTEPWLPDGTFLDQQFLEPDPRSLMEGPDMLKHREQQDARGGYYNYRSDADNSIPEKGIHPDKLRYLMRDSQNTIKSYLNIFDESLVGMQNSGSMSFNTSKPHMVDLTQFSAPYKPGFDVTQGQHAGAVTTLSNDTSIGWRSGVDHRFKVAHYGQTRGASRIQDQDWYKNRGSAKMDHDQPGYLYIEGSPVPHPTAQMIVDLTELRISALEGARNAKLGESKNCMTGIKRRLDQDDMTRMQAKFVQASQLATAHTRLNQTQGNKIGKQFQDPNTLQRNSVINQKIAEFISAHAAGGGINRKMGELNTDDLRSAIRRTAKDGGIYMTMTNNANMNMSHVDPMSGKYSTEYGFTRGTERRVHVYGANMDQSVQANMTRVDTSEGLGSSSKEADMRRRNQMLGDSKTTDDFEFTEMPEFAPHQIGKKGKMFDKSQSMRYSEHEPPSDEQMSEMSAFQRR